MFHDILEHRWYLNEESAEEVDLFDAARDYVERVLTQKPDTELTPPTPDEADLWQ